MTFVQTPPFPAIRLISQWQGILHQVPGLELASAQVLLSLKAGQWIKRSHQIEQLSKVSRMSLANTNRLLTCMHELNWIEYRHRDNGTATLYLTDDGERIISSLLTAMDQCNKTGLP